MLHKYVDPEIDALRLEIKSLELRINLLSNEKVDLEKLIYEFGVRHNKELGEFIIKLLTLRKEKNLGTPQQQEAEEDYKNYQKEYESAKNQKIFSLTEKELKKLKDNYRKASKLCHPDVVSSEQKELAASCFTELNIAYEKNDFKKVEEILANLENGRHFFKRSDTITEKIVLLNETNKLLQLIKELEEELLKIRRSESFNTINNIDNWDDYFTDAKGRLIIQIKDFENE